MEQEQGLAKDYNNNIEVEANNVLPPIPGTPPMPPVPPDIDGARPLYILCPFCWAFKEPIIRYEVNTKACLCCFIATLMACVLGTYDCEEWTRTRHFCPTCGCVLRDRGPGALPVPPPPPHRVESYQLWGWTLMADVGKY